MRTTIAIQRWYGLLRPEHIAGPRVLEHMVDTVLYLEGERYNTYRILTAEKNVIIIGAGIAGMGGCD